MRTYAEKIQAAVDYIEETRKHNDRGDSLTAIINDAANFEAETAEEHAAIYEALIIAYPETCERRNLAYYNEIF